ncbi:putative RNA methyltransferase [Gordonia sp. KTR9]|uniref:putative RNA methyltransferase n=1 Tax=Gordonia sp. KTR9 TaxID=337191 RepID=UPI00027DEA08|nr:type 11 methyltransferase [Gordonia sp. KTR9]AFR49982.1 SAM-dependent methyltransferase [Gordonia sp. KTR9]
MPHEGSSHEARADTPTPHRAHGLNSTVEILRCPVCAGPLSVDATSLRCPAAHSFDIARQGYVSLLDGRSGALRADTAAMVAARARVHDAGFFGAVVDSVARRAAEFASGLARPVILDAGAGGGHYLRAAVDAGAAAGGVERSSVAGIGIDLSKYCARAIARGPHSLAAIVADVWRGLPVVDDAVSVVLSVFAPRNAPEFARVLAPDGALIIVSPGPDHLAELIEPMGMLRVDSAKSARLHAALDDGFELVDESPLRYTASVDAATVGDLVAMGPSAFHSEEADIRSRADAFAGTGRVPVTVSVVMTTCRPARGRHPGQRRTDS